MMQLCICTLYNYNVQSIQWNNTYFLACHYITEERRGEDNGYSQRLLSQTTICIYTWGGSGGCACLREYSVCVNVGNRMEWFLNKNIGALGMLCRIGPQIQHLSLKCCLFTWCRATFFVFNMFKGFTLHKTCCLVCLKACVNTVW